MYGYLFELILAFLAFGDKWVRELAEPFLWPKLLRHAHSFQWVQNSIFRNGKHILTH